MTNPTLTNAFTTIRDRLVQMGKNAVPDTMHSLDYADQTGRGGNYPYWEVVIPRVQTDRITQGANRTRFTVTVEQRLWVDEFLAGYDGQAQEKLFWNYLPACLQYFDEHRTLKYTGATTGISFLQNNTSGVTDVQVRVVAGDDGVNALCCVFFWSIPLDTSFQVCF